MTADGALAEILALEADGFPATERWSEASWHSELTGDAFTVLTARSGSEIVGVIALRLAGEICELDRIVIDPQWRRQGVGRRLVEAGLQTAAAGGATEMILEVRSDNAAAIELYRDHGFQTLNVRRDYYAPGRDAVIMKSILGGGR